MHILFSISCHYIQKTTLTDYHFYWNYFISNIKILEFSIFIKTKNRSCTQFYISEIHIMISLQIKQRGKNIVICSICYTTWLIQPTTNEINWLQYSWISKPVFLYIWALEFIWITFCMIFKSIMCYSFCVFILKCDIT